MSNRIDKSPNRTPSGLPPEEETFIYYNKVALSHVFDYFKAINPGATHEIFISQVLTPAFNREKDSPDKHLNEFVSMDNSASPEKFRELQMNVALGYLSQAMRAKNAGFMGLAWACLSDARYFGGALNAGHREAFAKVAVAQQARNLVSEKANNVRHGFSRVVRAELMRLVRLLDSGKKWESEKTALSGCLARIRDFEKKWLEENKKQLAHTKTPTQFSENRMLIWITEMDDFDQLIEPKPKKNRSKS